MCNAAHKIFADRALTDEQAGLKKADERGLEFILSIAKPSTSLLDASDRAFGAPGLPRWSNRPLQQTDGCFASQPLTEVSDG